VAHYSKAECPRLLRTGVFYRFGANSKEAVIHSLLIVSKILQYEEGRDILFLSS